MAFITQILQRGPTNQSNTTSIKPPSLIRAVVVSTISGLALVALANSPCKSGMSLVQIGEYGLKCIDDQQKGYFIKPGQVSGSEGSFSCSLSPSVASSRECDYFLAKTAKLVKRKLSSPGDPAREALGGQIKLSNPGDPARNLRAKNYLQEKLGHVGEMSHQTFIDSLIQANHIYFMNIFNAETGEEMQKRGFRQVPTIIQDAQGYLSFDEHLEQFAQSEGISFEEAFHAHHGLMDQSKTYPEKLEDIENPLLRTFLKERITFPIPHTEIRSELKLFFSKFKKGLKTFKDCRGKDETARKGGLQFSAWVHQELIRIHPFSDGNGRLARMFMDFSLENAGFAPFVFTDRANYVEVVRDVNDSSKLATYLESCFFTKKRSIA